LTIGPHETPRAKYNFEQATFILRFHEAVIVDAPLSSPSKLIGRVLAVTAFYSAFVLAAGLAFAGGNFPIFLLVQNVVLLVLLVVFGIASLLQRRFGYLGAGIVSLVGFVLLQLSPVTSLVGTISNPASEAPPFLLFLPLQIAILVAVPYGFFGFYSARREGPPGHVSRSGILAFIGLGVVIGGLIVGTFAATTETGLLATSTPADITIVVGASNQGNQAGYYSPGNFTVKVGSSVSWVNHDTAAHTVTSTSVPSGASSFDSGNMRYGDRYSHAFTTAGIYHYTCNYHNFMTGTIIVTS
jgi:plastocyanin